MPPEPNGHGVLRERTRTVPAGQHCPKCDYPLVGLPEGGKCPECGTPIRSNARRVSQARDNLTDAPLGYLAGLRRAFGLLAAFGTGCALLQVAWFLTGLELVALLMALGGTGWASAVYLSTQPRPFVAGMKVHPGREHARLRAAARITQLAWIAQAALLFPVRANAGTPLASSLWNLAHIAQVIGIVGFAPLCLCLAHIADWGQDTNLSARLRVASALVAVGGLIAAVVAWLTPILPLGFISGSLSFTAILALVGCVIGMGMFLVAQLQLAAMARWAGKNAVASIARDQRVLERRARRTFSGQAAEGTLLAQMTAARGEGVLDPCAGCGYDLTGLPAGAKCPECGRAPEGGDTTFLRRSPPKPVSDTPLPLVGDEPEEPGKVGT